MNDFTLVIHGGFGEDFDLDPHGKAGRQNVVELALKEGRGLLLDKKLALDVVELLASRIEDSGLFNSGKGAVANENGEIRLDASIMDGRDRSFGAVGNLARTKNPISAARMALKQGNRFLVGPEGENFPLPTVEPSYFVNLDKKSGSTVAGGTIGVIALDVFGNMAAATTSGGFKGKPLGRIGDTPVIGAGTYAENGSCAVSSTGQGEYFIRTVAAHEISVLIKYKGLTAQEAASELIQKQIGAAGGTGGVIVVDHKGQVGWDFVKPETGMLRGFARKDEIKTYLFAPVLSHFTF